MSCPRCSSLILTKDGTTRWATAILLQSVRAALHRDRPPCSRGARLPRHIVLAVRWYVRYRLSSRGQRMVGERGVLVDPSTIYRWRTLPSLLASGPKVRDL